MNAAHAGTLIRFGAVAVACLILDLIVALVLTNRFGLPLPAAAAAGFASGAILGYVLHEYWTFRDGARTASRARALRFAITLSIVFAVRVGAVAGLEAIWPGPRAVLPILILAIGLSFTVNFLISRFLVFRPARPDARSAGPDRRR